jgi:hypothetical protein
MHQHIVNTSTHNRPSRRTCTVKTSLSGIESDPLQKYVTPGRHSRNMTLLRIKDTVRVVRSPPTKKKRCCKTFLFHVWICETETIVRARYDEGEKEPQITQNQKIINI